MRNDLEFERKKRIFEKTRKHNFIHSSRLEGIDIIPSDDTKTLDEILAKYRQKKK